MPPLHRIQPLLACGACTLLALGSLVALASEPAVRPPSPQSTSQEPAATPSAAIKPVAADPAPAETTKPATGQAAKLSFNFRYQPWQDVLDWFAEQADLSLVLESPPSGTFNYHDGRTYTPAEALDVINSVLLTKGFTLVKSGRMLVLVNLEDGIPPNLVTDVPLAELDQHGEYEIIRVTFPVLNMSAEEAAKEVEHLIGPQGTVIILPQSKRIQVTETGGRLRAIRSVINAVERPDVAGNIREIPLQHLSFEDALPYLRQLLAIPNEAFSTADGQLNIGKDVTGRKLLVHGTPERIARAEEVVRLIDVPDAAHGVAGAPQLEVYPITTADPQSVLQILQTLLEGDSGVKLAVDPVTGHLVAFARPAQQATIRATIEQMQRDARQVAVIPLETVDPQVAVLSITKLFGGLDKEKPDPSAPRVDADITTRSLLVRGTAGQVKQIRELLAQMGESEEATAGAGKSNERVRLLPLTGAQARSALSQIEQIWPTMRPNRIRVVLPSQSIQTFRPSDDSTPEGAAQPPVDAPAEAVEPSAYVPLDRSRVHFAQLLRYVDDQVSPTGENRPGAPIVVAPGPGGVLIASDDLEALDDFEELLTTVSERNTSATRDYAVFYLKYAKAANVSEVLSAIFGGGTKGGGIVNEMAGAALGDLGGGLMGNLLLGGGGGGASGGSFSSGSVDIVPDVRLNALIVRAKPSDLDTVEQLLRVLDQRVGPEEVEADSRPRLIPVYNTQASEIAPLVQQVYQDRLASGGPAVMSPQDMLKMIRGNSANLDQQTAKMSIGIDERSNSLIVRAPDPLFEEVKALVAELDKADMTSPEITRVVSLKHTNSSAVQRALVSVLGDQARTSTTTSTQTRAPWDQGQNRGGEGGNNDDAARDARRRMWRNMEMFREMQRMNERMGGGGGGGDRGGRGRGGEGRGPGGGGPPGGFPGGGFPGGGPPGGRGGRGD